MDRLFFESFIRNHRPALVSMVGVSLILSALPLSTLAARERTVKFSGRAVIQSSGRHFYTEYHSLTLNGKTARSSVVRYVAPGGKLLAVRSSDFRAGLLAPRSTLDVKSDGVLEKITPRGGGNFLLSYRAGPGQAAKTKTIKVPAPVVAGQGLGAFMYRNWTALRGGTEQRFQMLVPSRLDFYRFRVKKVGATRINGKPATRFSLSLFGVLGAVLPKIEFAFDDATRRLMRYSGPAAFKGGLEQAPNIRVDFSYPNR